MRLHPLWGLILFLLGTLATACAARSAETPTPAGYSRESIEGFIVFAAADVTARRDDGFGRRPLDVLQKELNDLHRILHPQIVSDLQAVPIWVEWDRVDERMPGAIARYYGGDAEKLARLGGDPRRANCIEVLTLRRLAEIRRPGTALQQVIILHEMAHAVHHRLLGWDNPELKAIYQAAMDRKLYDEVNDRFGRRGPAYARTNHAEYFAELSCAYLDSCNFFPFNQQQLRGYDAEGFQFVDRVWREPERFRVVRGKHSVAQHAPPAAAQPSVAAQRDAHLRLDRIKILLKQERTDEAKAALEQLIRSFPGTDAADEAREILSEIK